MVSLLADARDLGSREWQRLVFHKNPGVEQGFVGSEPLPVMVSRAACRASRRK